MAGKRNGAVSPKSAAKRTRTRPEPVAAAGSPPVATQAEAGSPGSFMVPDGSDKSAKPKIFHIFFEPWQRDLLDPEFVPLDNQGAPSELLEFDLFERLAASEHVRHVPLWGALSWRFTEKAGLSGKELLELVAENPGYDVYYCNPFPQHEALYHNLWLQGETSHPRFIELVHAFLEAAGLPDNTGEIVPSQLYSTANYFVGTPLFWKTYLPFVRSAVARAEKNLPEATLAALHSTAADERGVHGGSTYMPFIVERLFALFMCTAGRELKGFKLPLAAPEQEMNVHLKLLREMKDVAWSTRSAWMVACWTNYRNLYFMQLHGVEWTRKYLRAITPTDITFARERKWM